MSGEILIVGDAGRRRELVERVSGLGYDVDVCTPRDLSRVIRMERRPAAILVAMDDTDPAVLLAGLRRTREGAAIPVVLYGRLGGAIRDLADVLDLGGDQFVEDPASSATLREVLLELAGPPSGLRAGGSREGGARSPRGLNVDRGIESRVERGVEPGWSMQTDRIRARDDDAFADPRRREPSPDRSAASARGAERPRGLDPREPPAGSDAAVRRDPTRSASSPSRRGAWQDDVEQSPRGGASSREGAGVAAGTPSEPDARERARPGGVRGDPRATPASAHAGQGRVDSRTTSNRRGAGERHEGDVDDARTTSSSPLRGVHRTLERLEARLRDHERDGFDAFEDDVEERDDLERLGLAEVPDVEADADDDELDPADSLAGLPVVDPSSDVVTTGIHEPPRRRVELTERLTTDTGTMTRTGFVDAPRGRAAPPRGAAEASPVLRARRPEQVLLRADELDAPLERAMASVPSEERRDERGRVHRVGPSRTPWTSRGSGELGELDVAALLLRLHEEGLTGCLSLVNDRTEKRLWMVEGQVTFARSNAASDRLVDSLARRGILTRAQLDTARRLVERDPRRAGRVLVEAGLLKASEIERVLRDHLLRVIVSAFDWTSGSWRIDAGSHADEPILLDLATPTLVVTGVRESLDDGFLKDRLSAVVPRPAIDERACATLRDRDGAEAFTRAELAFFEQVDGRRTLEGCIRASGLDEHDALAALYLAWIMGCVTSLGARTSRGEQTDPRALDRARIFERLAVAREGDYFAVLGVRRDASRGEIRRAWAESAAVFADDALEPETADELADELEELRLSLQEARDILLDDALRSAYLAHLDPPEAARPRS